MKKIYIITSCVFLSASVYAQRPRNEKIENKENKIETIKIINGDTVFHDIRIVSGDIDRKHHGKHYEERIVISDQKFDEEIELALEELDIYINIDNNHKKMLVKKMKLNDEDLEAVIQSLEEDEDIILDMKDGKREIKIIKIDVDERDGELIKTIEVKEDSKLEKEVSQSPNTKLHNDILKVFPNPAQNEINFEFEVTEDSETTVTIRKDDGKEIFSKTYTEPGQYKENVAVNNNQKGIFLITLKDNSRSIIKKIIID